MAAGSYVDVFQVQGVQVLMVPLPQYGRPPLPCDGACQHSTLADCYGGHAQFLVIGEGQQVHICRGRNKKVTVLNKTREVWD